MSETFQPSLNDVVELESDPVGRVLLKEVTRALKAAISDIEPASQIGQLAEGASIARLFDEWELDSLDVVEIIMGLEDEFSIDLPDEECEKWSTIGDIVRTVAARIDLKKYNPD